MDVPQMLLEWSFVRDITSTHIKTLCVVSTGDDSRELSVVRNSKLAW